MSGHHTLADTYPATFRRSTPVGRVTLASAMAALLSLGCAGADDAEPTPVRVVAEAERAPIPASAACEDGALRECQITLNIRNGTVTCTTGVEECRNGAWGECLRTTDPEEESAQ